MKDPRDKLENAALIAEILGVLQYLYPSSIWHYRYLTILECLEAKPITTL